MNRACMVCGAVLLAAASALCDQKPAAAPPAQPTPPVKNNNAPKNAAKGGFPKGEQRLVNPANPATRLFTATPEERERALEQMNPKQQENARALLLWYDRLPKDVQTLQLRRLERFMQLTPGQRSEVRALHQQVNELAPARKRMIGEALLRLQMMPDAQRTQTLNSPAFKERFTPDEQRIIARLADAWLPPV
jgi:hypothetical protein